MAVDAAPVVTVPVVAEAPTVTVTLPVPADANAPVVPDTSEQNQRLFLPIITNLANLAGAALGGAGGMVALVVVGLVVIGGLVWQRRSRRKV